MDHCVPMMVPVHLRAAAARAAEEVNPANAAPRVGMSALAASVGVTLGPSRLALATSKFWGAQGVSLTVSFMSAAATHLKDRLLTHANAWGKLANITFRLTSGVGQVRVSFGPGGYYSFLGTDCLVIPQHEHTMNLEAFSDDTPDDEFYRVVRHEFGHACGFQHEHLRKEVVDDIEPEKAYDYFQRRAGWDRQMVNEQVLTALDPRDTQATPQADRVSIMCYQLPGSIMRDGRDVPGGTDIDALDHEFAAKCYPKSATPPPPPASDAAFSFVLRRDVRKGEVISFPFGKDVPRGTYDARRRAGSASEPAAVTFLEESP